MAQTFRDFAYECEMYPYSKDSYNLLKECMEISLMEKYVDNQEYVSSCMYEVESGEITLTESYFSEAVNKETLENIKKNIVDKAGKIWETIATKMKDLVRKLLNFFRKLVNRLTKTGDLSAKVLKALQARPLTKKDVNDIWKMFKSSSKVDDSEKKGAPAYNILNNKTMPQQPFKGSLKLSYEDNAFSGFKASSKDQFENVLAIVLSNGTVAIPAPNGAVNGTQLVEWMYRVLLSRNASTADNVAGSVKKAMEKSAQKGYVLIDANISKINAIVSKLEDLQDRLENQKEAKATAAANAPQNEDESKKQYKARTSEDANNIRASYDAIMKASAEVIKIYSAYANVRVDGLAKVNTYVQNRQPAAEK